MEKNHIEDLAYQEFSNVRILVKQNEAYTIGVGMSF